MAYTAKASNKPKPQVHNVNTVFWNLQLTKKTSSLLVKIQHICECNNITHNSLCYNLAVLINCLQQSHNYLTYTVAKAPKSSHMTPILHSLHWLKIKESIEYKLLWLTLKFLQSLNHVCMTLSVQPTLPAALGPHLVSPLFDHNHFPHCKSEVIPTDVHKNQLLSEVNCLIHSDSLIPVFLIPIHTCQAIMLFWFITLNIHHSFTFSLVS